MYVNNAAMQAPPTTKINPVTKTPCICPSSCVHLKQLMMEGNWNYLVKLALITGLISFSTGINIPDQKFSRMIEKVLSDTLVCYLSDDISVYLYYSIVRPLSFIDLMKDCTELEMRKSSGAHEQTVLNWMGPSNFGRTTFCNNYTEMYPEIMEAQ